LSLADPLCRRLIVKVMDEMTKYEIQYLMRAVTDLISMLFLHQFRNSRSVQNLRDPELMWSFGHFDSHLTSESFLFFRKNVLIKGSTSRMWAHTIRPFENKIKTPPITRYSISIYDLSIINNISHSNPPMAIHKPMYVPATE
jgi:hypothetical protein